ncbi:MAG: ATP-dependent helicase [bacterium]|nr:ATP-dependent helicase [bacterium]
MTQLNKQQFKASRPTGGISLVIAGAGTGKTKTLVEKVQNIIRDSSTRETPPAGGSIKPENILILTFSRKAAEEIKERVMADIKTSASGINSGTFHSFCLGFLKDYREQFISAYGFKTFPAILDDNRREEIIAAILETRLKNFLGLPKAVVLTLALSMNTISDHTKNKLQSTGLFDALLEVTRLFAEEKRKLALIDFDDMMSFTIELLESDPELRAAVHQRYRYILVDEFQDTSDNNFKLIRLLLPEGKENLFAVGDDWQSIYGFRKARVEYIISMQRYFPGAAIHKLTINYRSRKEIVKISNSFIRKNRFRTKKRLLSFKGKGGKIFYYHVSDIEDEVSRVKSIIQKEYTHGRAPNIAILYRNNWQGEHLRRGLRLPGNEYREVQFMTMHASKGLEFDVVIIAGVSDKIIPDKTTDLEEERRLFYVALSRAKERLHVVSHFNDEGVVSRFGRELGMKRRKK